MNLCYMQKIEIQQNGDTSKLQVIFVFLPFLFSVSGKTPILEIVQRI